MDGVGFFHCVVEAWKRYHVTLESLLPGSIVTCLPLFMHSIHSIVYNLYIIYILYCAVWRMNIAHPYSRWVDTVYFLPRYGSEFARLTVCEKAHSTFCPSISTERLLCDDLRWNRKKKVQIAPWLCATPASNREAFWSVTITLGVTHVL